jgi:4-amino-4-deoxy-L-arabinose transferase-like glycosyltransferase
MEQARAKAFFNPAVVGFFIFLVAFVARALWVLRLKNDVYWDDEHAFLAIARHLVRGEGYISDSYRANPMLPVYLSLVFRFFGENLFVARLGQCIAGALTCVLICAAGTRLFDRATGIVSGVILAVYPPLIYLSGVFYAECLLIFWGSVAVYLAVRSLRPRTSVAWGLATGVALGVAVLTRATLVVWIPIVCIAWLWNAAPAWRARAPLCVALLVGSAVTIVPWTVRNYYTFHCLVPVNSGFGTILWQANNPFSTGLGHSDWELFPNCAPWTERLAQAPVAQRSALEARYKEVDARIHDLTGQFHDRMLALDRVLGPLAFRYMAAHPLQTLVRSGRRLRLLFSAFSPTVTSNEHTAGFYKTVAALSFYPILILAACGMALGARRLPEVALPYLLIVSVIGMTSLMVATQSRYRLIVDPYLILFASFALTQLRQRWMGARGAPAVPD